MPCTYVLSLSIFSKRRKPSGFTTLDCTLIAKDNFEETVRFSFSHPKLLWNHQIYKKKSTLGALVVTITNEQTTIFFVRKNCFSDEEKCLKFENESWEFAKNLNHYLDQLIRILKDKNTFWNRMFFNSFHEVSQI